MIVTLKVDDKLQTFVRTFAYRKHFHHFALLV